MSNRAISSDLNGPRPRFKGQAIFLTLNVSEMAKDTAIVTMEGD